MAVSNRTHSKIYWTKFEKHGRERVKKDWLRTNLCTNLLADKDTLEKASQDRIKLVLTYFYISIYLIPLTTYF